MLQYKKLQSIIHGKFYAKPGRTKHSSRLI